MTRLTSYYISSGVAAKNWGMTTERVEALCRAGEIPGAYEVYRGGHWLMPADSVKPRAKGN